MTVEKIMFNKFHNGGIARIGNGMDVRYTYSSNMDSGSRVLEVQFVLFHFDEWAFSKTYTTIIYGEGAIESLIADYTKKFLEDDALPKIEEIRQEFTPGVCRMLEDHKRKIEHLEHIVETLIQKIGGGY